MTVNDLQRFLRDIATYSAAHIHVDYDPAGFRGDCDVPLQAYCKVSAYPGWRRGVCAYFDRSGQCVWDVCEQGVPVSIRPSYRR